MEDQYYLANGKKKKRLLFTTKYVKFEIRFEFFTVVLAEVNIDQIQVQTSGCALNAAVSC